MNDILNEIGKTAFVKLKSHNRVKVYAKLEGQNPSGSIKDRAALYMIEQAIAKKELRPGMTIIEASSGNMGISLSMIGQLKGFKVEIVMSEAMSKERRQLIQAYGAKLWLSSKKGGSKGAINMAKKLSLNFPEKYWFSDQFYNPDNQMAHYHGIAQEIIKSKIKFDYVIAGLGTSGTITGISKAFKAIGINTKIIGIIPPSGYKIQGIQNPDKDFTPGIYNARLIDSTISISYNEAKSGIQKLALKEGIIGGLSSGAAYSAAIKLSQQISGNVLLIFPDRGEKYLSMGLFA